MIYKNLGIYKKTPNGNVEASDVEARKALHTNRLTMMGKGKNAYWLIDNEAKSKKLPIICCKVMNNEFKCGGCNWEAQNAYYLSTDAEPEFDKDDPDRITTGLCAYCFMETIKGCEVKP